jgi:hypothetical protein
VLEVDGDARRALELFAAARAVRDDRAHPTAEPRVRVSASAECRSSTRTCASCATCGRRRASSSTRSRPIPGCVAEERAGLRSRKAPAWSLTLRAHRHRAGHPRAVPRSPRSRSSRGGLERRPRDGRGVLRRRLRAVGRHHVRPAGGPPHARPLPRPRRGRRLQLRRRARLGQGLGRGDPLQRRPAPPVRRVLRPDGHLQPGRVQRLPAAGPAGLGAVARPRGPVQPRFMRNASGRFESRFATVRIEESPAVMLRGMAGSVLGVWTAHGEGRAWFPDAAVLERVERAWRRALRGRRRPSPRPTRSTPTARRRASPGCAHPTAATWR